MIKSLVVGAALALALTAFLNMSAMAQNAPRNIAANLCARPEAHCVKTTVQGGRIVVDPVDVHVPGPRNRFHRIVWYLDTDGYEFVNAAGNRPVTFKTANTQMNPEDPVNGCFHYSDTSVPRNTRVFVCLNKNTATGKFPYTIKVTPTGSLPAVPPLDPSVFNDN